MDVARVPISRDLGTRVIFVVETLRTDGLWTYLQAVPHTPDGAPLNWLQTPMAEDWRAGIMSDVVMVLLRKNGPHWQIIDYVIGPTDVFWYEWIDQFGLPEALFYQP